MNRQNHPSINQLAQQGRAREMLAMALLNVLALFEIAAGLAWAKSVITVDALIASHVLVVCLMGVVWRKNKDRNLRWVPFGFIGVFFAGPLGAVGQLLLSVLTSFKRPDDHLLAEWHQKLAGAKHRNTYQLLYQSISSGRAIGSGDSSITNFPNLAKQGSIEEKQKMLGIMAVKYHPDFYPILKMTLRDQEPVVRVQAAAAYAKLRMMFKTRFSEALSPIRKDDEPGLVANEKAKMLESCIQSGFLDESEVKQARAALALLQSNQNWPMKGAA